MTQFFNMKKEYWREHYADALQPEYRKVEYIECTGEQWIDTGVLAKSTLTVEAKASIANIVEAQVLIGGRDHLKPEQNRKSYIIWCMAPNRICRFDYGDNNIAGENMTLGTVVVFRKDKQYNFVNGVQAASNIVSTFVSHNTMYLFSQNQDEPPSTTAPRYFYRGKAYYCIIQDESVFLRNFIPVVRLSDNKPGMYDLCGSISAKTGTPFYVNEGTGADFLWGELS